MSIPVLPTVRLPGVNGNEYVTPEGKVVGIPSSSKFSVSWPEENLTRQTAAPAATSSSEPPSEEEHSSDSDTGKGPCQGQNSGQGSSSAPNDSDNSQPSQSPGPPRFSRALSLPLPSQLGYLKHPYRSHVSSPRLEDPASSESAGLQALCVELADSVQMMIQTVLHISPPQLLDPAKEQFSACSLSVPTSSVSAMLTTMKSLNYISELMYELCSPPRSGDVSPEAPPPKPNMISEFDIGEMLQSVGDSLSGAAALAGVDLVLYHGDDIGLRHVTVQGDENGMSYILSHMVRQIVTTAKPGDSVELGLLIGPLDTRPIETETECANLGADRTLACAIRVSHKFNGESAEDGKPRRPAPNFTSLLLRRLLHHLGAKITCDIPLPKSITHGRSCELSLTLEQGAVSVMTPIATLPNEEDPITGEPSVEQLIGFAESLRGKRVTLYADEKGSFGQHLTSYLTAWGMDVTHISPTGEMDGMSDPLSGPLVATMPLTPAAATSSTANAELNGAARNKASPAFVFIDDDIDLLRERLRLLRSEKAPLEAALRKRPSLAAHHRPKSSPQITRAMGAQRSLQSPTPQDPSIIVHFTSLANYKLVKDVVQSVIVFHINSCLPIPEIMIIPKPAGPRRFLAALHTAITKPVVDPIFSPIATTPSSPSVHPGGYFFQNHHGNIEPPNDSPHAGRGVRPQGPRSNSDRSAKSAKGISDLYNNHPPSPSPLALSDNAEYFAEAVTKLGASPSSGLVIQNPDGQPAGIFFHPKQKSSRTPSAQSMERDKGHLQVSTDRSARRRSSSRLSISSTSPSALSFSSLHKVTQSPTSTTSPAEAGLRVALPINRGACTPPSIRKSPRMDGREETANASINSSREVSGGMVGSTTPRRSANSTPHGERQHTPPASPKPEAVGGTPSLKRGTNSRKTMDGGGGSPGSVAGQVGRRRNKGQTDNNIVPPISVLIVDDNPINQTILSTFMRKKKIKYEVANNGQEAVEKWKTGEFHLILMDIQMPVMDGIQATKEIRRMEAQNATLGYPPSDLNLSLTPSPSEASNEIRSASTPYRSSVIIVALTASSLQSDRVAALAAGCNDFLTKPVSLLWLNNKIIEWGSIKALQMWADLRPEGIADVGAEQARSVAERLHVPSKGRTPSPNRKNSANTVTQAAVTTTSKATLMTPTGGTGGKWPNIEVTSSPHSGRSLEELAQDLAQGGRLGSSKGQVSEDMGRADEDST